MKQFDLVKKVELQAFEAVQALLREIPQLTTEEVQKEHIQGRNQGYDFRFDLRHAGRPYTIVAEVKSQGQPRYVRNAIYQLRNYIAHQPNHRFQPIPVLIAPYLSMGSRALCNELGVSYVDLYGNARLAFGSVFIDRAVADKPKSESRSLRSIFSPKASAILRAMIQNPSKPWRVTDLAETAKVSLGHVSNVRKALFEREWIEEHPDGVVLTNPRALLETWRENYRRPLGQSIRGYTHFHGAKLEDRLRFMGFDEFERPRAICAMNSAAKWISPFGRDAMNTFYADAYGTDLLKDTLQFSQTSKGANVIIRTIKDESLFKDAVEPVSGIFCTSPVQTYLDLWNGNERDRESAQVLAEEHFPWLH